MTTARQEVVCEGEGIYHCISRCVRRAFLHGFDSATGKNFDHRKGWVRDRLILLTEVFSIEVLSYALMCNHQHTLLRTKPRELKKLTDEQVARRWFKLFPPGGKLKEPFEEILEKRVQALVEDKERIALLRKRLGSISWFMKSLNEYLARRANKEDDCKGRFWEGRFKCQRLCDEGAVLSCAIYIDLNPIRASRAKTPEESIFTSAWERIQALKKARDPGKEPSLWLAPIQDSNTRKGFLSLSLNEYLEILDTTGRAIQDGKRGKIPEHIAPILTRLNIRADNWTKTTTHYGRWFSRVVGQSELIRAQAQVANKNWFKGVRAAKMAFLG